MLVYLKKKYSILSIYLFGNTLGITVNLIYFSHHLISKLYYKTNLIFTFNNKKNSKVTELKKNGVSIVGKYKNIQKIKKKFNYYFSKKRRNLTTRKDKGGYFFLRKNLLKNFYDEIDDFLKSDLDNLLKKYYKSNYDIYWVEIIRSYPILNHNDNKSLLFHFDDNPNSVLKTFIYLNDQDEDSGAFKTLLKKDSEKIKKSGFLSYTTKDRKKNQHMIENYIMDRKVKTFKGKKGSILIFQNNIVHKGNLPKKNYRDLIVLETIPSIKKIDKYKIKKSLKRKIDRDFPVNPFKYN